jgi:hypothetical protein
MLQPRTLGLGIAPYSQHLGDFFTWIVSVLVKSWTPNYSAELGMGRLCRISPGKVSLNLPPAAPVARQQPGGGVWDVRVG